MQNNDPFSVIQQQLEKLHQELLKKDKEIGRFMDQQVVDAAVKRASDAKYFRLKNQLGKISEIAIELKKRASASKLIILRQDKELKRLMISSQTDTAYPNECRVAAADAFIAAIHSDTSVRLESQSQVIETLQRESVEMFARIGEERQNAQVREAYLESLLVKNGIPFDTDRGDKNEAQSGLVAADIPDSQEPGVCYGSSRDESGCPFDSAGVYRKKRKNQDASAYPASSFFHPTMPPLVTIKEEKDEEEKDLIDHNGGGEWIAEDISAGETALVALAAEVVGPKRSDASDIIASSGPMTATQPLVEYFRGEELDDFLSSSQEELTEDEGGGGCCKVTDDGSKEFEDQVEQDYDNCMQLPENHRLDLSSSQSQPMIPSKTPQQEQDFEDADRTLADNAEKAATTMRDQPVLKKLKVYSKASNFQFDTEDALAGRGGLFKALDDGALVLPEKSFKTAAGMYIQRKVAPVSASAPLSSTIDSKSKTDQTDSKIASSFFESSSSAPPTLPTTTPSSAIPLPFQIPAQQGPPATSAFKYNQVVRDKATRNLMHGTDCACCKDYYAATADLKRGTGRTGGGTGIKESRHKVWTERPKTPEGYWNVDFPSTQEVQDHQKKLMGHR